MSWQALHGFVDGSALTMRPFLRSLRYRSRRPGARTNLSMLQPELLLQKRHLLLQSANPLLGNGQRRVTWRGVIRSSDTSSSITTYTLCCRSCGSRLYQNLPQGDPPVQRGKRHLKLPARLGLRQQSHTLPPCDRGIRGRFRGLRRAEFCNKCTRFPLLGPNRFVQRQQFCPPIGNAGHGFGTHVPHSAETPVDRLV